MRNRANRHDQMSYKLHKAQEDLYFAREEIYQLNDVIRILKQEIKELKSNDTNRQESVVAQI